jgi:hypothetical protein
MKSSTRATARRAVSGVVSAAAATRAIKFSISAFPSILRRRKARASLDVAAPDGKIKRREPLNAPAGAREAEKRPESFDDAGSSALFRALVLALKRGAGWPKLRRRTKIAMNLSHC